MSLQINTRMSQLLACLCIAFTAPLTLAAEYLPNIERREVVTPGIDQDHFEITAAVSLLSVQDFQVEPYFGFRVAYHLHESFFIEASAGQADVGLSSTERLFSGNSGSISNVILLEDRLLTDYHLSVGWNFLPGYVNVMGKTHIMTGYLISGIGTTNFANQNNMTFNFGGGYRLLVNDTLSIKAEARDYVVNWDTPLLGDINTQHNIALTLGVGLVF